MRCQVGGWQLVYVLAQGLEIQPLLDRDLVQKVSRYIFTVCENLANLLKME